MSGQPLGFSGGGRQLPPELSPRRPSRRRRAARVTSWLACAVSVLVLAGSGALYVLYNKYDGNITRVAGVFTRSPDAKARPAEVDGAGDTFLLVGSDSREGLTKEQLAESRTTFDGTNSTDTMLLVTLSKKRDAASIVSFPRDSWVDIPGHGKGKLNSAKALGGPQLLVSTIEDLTDVRIDHYVEVGFVGFLNMTKAVGGVEVCLKKAVKDKDSGADFTAGPQTLNGSDALSFVRQRKGLPNGDLDRINRQQAFIAALLQKATSTSVLLNPIDLNRLLDAATSALTTDEDLTINDLRKLAGRLKGLDPARVSFETIPLRDPPIGMVGDASVVFTAPVPVLQEFFSKITLDIQDQPAAAAPPAPSAAQPIIVPPGGVAVRVLNASGQNGLAAKVSGDLSRAGFRAGGVGTATSADAAGGGIVVRFGPDKADSARTVAASIPGARLQPDSSLTSTVVVVVSDGYAGVKPVSVGQQVTVPGDTVLPAPTAPAPTDVPAPPSPETTGDQKNCVN